MLEKYLLNTGTNGIKEKIVYLPTNKPFFTPIDSKDLFYNNIIPFPKEKSTFTHFKEYCVDLYKHGIFYEHTAIGKNGKEFSTKQLRTMYYNANDTKKYPINHLQRDALGKITDDPRIMPFGKILRKKGLDHLPQIINLLNGTMRLAGHRPRPSEHWDLFSSKHKERALKRKPGICPPQ